MRRFIEVATGEEYTHKAVWRVVIRQMEHAKAHPTGAQLDHLVVIVFASHALEGYANFLGEKIAPDLWRNEREAFRKTGLSGKLVALHEQCGLPAPAKGRRPWATMADLKRLRDKIAHPRTATLGGTERYDEGKTPPLFAKSWIDKAVTPIKAQRAVEDVKAIVEPLHEAATSRFPLAGLLPGALEGIQWLRSTRSSPIDD